MADQWNFISLKKNSVAFTTAELSMPTTSWSSPLFLCGFGRISDVRLGQDNRQLLPSGLRLFKGFEVFHDVIHVRAGIHDFEADAHVSEKRRLLHKIGGQSHRLDVLQSHSAVESTAEPSVRVELQMERKHHSQDCGSISESEGSPRLHKRTSTHWSVVLRRHV